MKDVETVANGSTPNALERCYWRHGNEVATTAASPTGESPADVIVIGGGFAGLATACRIGELRPDAKTILLEANSVGYGASGRNGGLVSPLAAPIWLAGALRNGRQSDALRLLYRKTHEAAQWAAAHAPDAEVRRTVLNIAAQGPLTAAGLSEVADVIARSGIPIERDSGARRHSDLRLACYTVQPYKLAVGLARYARQLGVQILENAAVRSIDASRRGVAVTMASGETLHAERVVVSTNAYFQSIAMASRPPGKVVRNFMLATAPLSEAQQTSLQSCDHFVVELNRKYIFYRMHAGRLMFGGIDKVGQSRSRDDFEIPGDVLGSLRSELSARVLDGRQLPIDFAWGGRFHMTATDLPFIARCSVNPSVIYNLGYGGTGVALTLALAPVAAAMALGQDVRDDEAEFVFQTMRETRLPIFAGAQLAGRVAKRAMAAALASD